MRCSQWRYQDGHDREMMEKATRVVSDEDKEMMERPIEGRNGELRKIEHILGRSKLKKSFQYEVKFKGLDHKVCLYWPPMGDDEGSVRRWDIC